MCDTARTSDGNLLTEEQKNFLREKGDYNCDSIVNEDDIFSFILWYNRNNPGESEIFDFILAYNQNFGNTINLGLQDLSSQDTTQDLTQVTRQQAQEELDTAAASDRDIGINKLAIINVPITPGTAADGFNIFFKGPEVLEYLVTFGNNVDSTIKTLANQTLFHNLFTRNNPTLYNSEQAFRTDGTKVYQARRSNEDDIRPNNTYNWDSTYLIHMFTSPYPITSLTKIRFQDEILLDTTTNPTGSNSVAIRTILPS